jgi:hypothetical protein
MEKAEKPLNTCISSPLQRHDCISTVYFLKKKRQKKLSTQRLKFCALKGKSVSIM